VAVDPQLLSQALRTPESQDVTETPIVRAVILPNPANAADLVTALTRPDTLESRNARRVLCQFGPDATPHLLTALVSTPSTYARREGLEVLWALLAVEEVRVVREMLRSSAAELASMLRDVSPLPDDMPEYIERDFSGRVCDLAYIVARELLNNEFDQSSFRALDNDGRDDAIEQLLSRGFGNPVA
jgi:hypothetical protein